MTATGHRLDAGKRGAELPRLAFARSAPPEVRDALIVQQYRRMHKFLPVLCLLIGTNAIAMTMALLGDLPMWQQLTPPAILVATCVLVPLLAHNREADQPPAELARAMNRGAAVTAGFGLLASAWCINAFNETEQYYCLVAPVFIALSAVVCATCLLSVPRMAIAAMVATLVPVAVKLMSYDNVGLRSIAVMLLLLGMMQSHVIMANFAETVRGLVLQQRLDRLASTDAVTGIDNRFAFMDKLTARIAAQVPVAVIVADLDRFKQANDTHGHAAGDAILREVARRLQHLSPTAISVARLGGDEFALLFVAGEGHERAETPDLAALRVAIGMPIEFAGAMLSVSGSFGLAYSDEGIDSAEALLHRADLRLYRDKSAGRAPAPRRKVQREAA